MTGTIVRVLGSKGFGWIDPDGHHAAVFFHAGQLQGLMFSEALVNERVSFEVEIDPRTKRGRGKNVRRERP